MRHPARTWSADVGATMAAFSLATAAAPVSQAKVSRGLIAVSGAITPEIAIRSAGLWVDQVGLLGFGYGAAGVG